MDFLLSFLILKKKLKTNKQTNKVRAGKPSGTKMIFTYVFCIIMIAEKISKSDGRALLTNGDYEGR